MIPDVAVGNDAILRGNLVISLLPRRSQTEHTSIAKPPESVLKDVAILLPGYISAGGEFQDYG